MTKINRTYLVSISLLDNNDLKNSLIKNLAIYLCDEVFGERSQTFGSIYQLLNVKNPRDISSALFSLNIRINTDEKISDS